MKDRDKNTALHFGIMDKCEKLEKELLQIDGITEVKFDLDGFWSGIYQVIILTKYDIPVSLENYEVRKSVINQVIKVAKGNSLKRTEDAIEDYGEHFYFVFRCMKEWRTQARKL
jgi:hypothetical protein